MNKWLHEPDVLISFEAVSYSQNAAMLTSCDPSVCEIDQNISGLQRGHHTT